MILGKVDYLFKEDIYAIPKQDEILFPLVALLKDISQEIDQEKNILMILSFIESLGYDSLKCVKARADGKCEKFDKYKN